MHRGAFPRVLCLTAAVLAVFAGCADDDAAPVLATPTLPASATTTPPATATVTRSRSESPSPTPQPASPTRPASTTATAPPSSTPPATATATPLSLATLGADYVLAFDAPTATLSLQRRGDLLLRLP